MSYDENLKFVVLGEGRVGKNAILSKYFTNKFNEGEKNTINPAFFEKTWNYKGKKFNLKFYDTAGQETFNPISTIYCQNAVGALIVYDVTIPETFEKAKSWADTLRELVGEDIVIVFAGNKYDLADKISLEESRVKIEEYCKQKQFKHFYTADKTGFNLDAVFECLITSALEKVMSNNNEGNKRRRGKKLEIREQLEAKHKTGCY